MTQTNNDSIKKYLKDLYSENGATRQRARQALVKIGSPIVDFLIELDYSNNEKVRWEVMKALSQIADSGTVSLMVDALKDKNVDIRWIAAEGLIEIGKDSIVPVLQELKKDPDSMYLRRGAHHIINELKKRDIYEDKRNIIPVLKENAVTPTMTLKAEEVINDFR